MKTFTSAIALAAALSLGSAAYAQASGGPDAKGNAPLKHAHTVDDGAAKRGANSFTEKQAMEHIQKSGFTGVTGLAKGDDGVWRGHAMRDGRTVDVAMDFKGNVSTGGASGTSTASATTTSAEPRTSESRTAASTTATRSTTTATAADGTVSTARAARHHRHHRSHAACANPSPNGAACSGIDRNQNGVSDREDRAINASAHP